MAGKLRRVAETSRRKAGCRKPICVMLFEGDLVHRFLAPLEASSLAVVDFDESIDAALYDSYPDWDSPNDIACRGLRHVVAWLSLAESGGRSAL